MKDTTHYKNILLLIADSQFEASDLILKKYKIDIENVLLFIYPFTKTNDKAKKLYIQVKDNLYLRKKANPVIIKKKVKKTKTKGNLL